MKSSRKIVTFSLYVLMIAGLALSPAIKTLAQDESPMPGGSNTSMTNDNIQSPAADPAGVSPTNSAPIPGNQPSSPESNQTDTSSHNSFQTPISLTALQAYIQELKSGGTDKTEESLNKCLVSLDVLIKAHNKLAAAFAKQPDMSAACSNERNLAKELYPIKDQVLYLKAQTLITENRWTEAVTILVDIISVEPTSALGQQAYRRLKEIGFSPDSVANTSRLSNKNRTRQLSSRPIKTTTAKITVHQIL